MNRIKAMTAAFDFIINKLILLGGFIVSIVLELTGNDSKGLEILLVLIALDYITGLIKGGVFKRIRSLTGIKGILKKIAYIMAVGVGHQLDMYFSDGDSIRNLIMGMLIVNEAISCLENLEAIGFPFPDKLKKILQQCKK